MLDFFVCLIFDRLVNTPATVGSGFKQQKIWAIFGRVIFEQNKTLVIERVDPLEIKTQLFCESKMGNHDVVDKNFNFNLNHQDISCPTSVTEIDVLFKILISGRLNFRMFRLVNFELERLRNIESKHIFQAMHLRKVDFSHF